MKPVEPDFAERLKSRTPVGLALPGAERHKARSSGKAQGAVDDGPAVAGFDRHLLKPVDIADLTRTLEDFAQRSA